jgi:hypothetical protein
VQKSRMVALMNEGKIVFAHPGYFYVMPFFVTKDP